MHRKTYSRTLDEMRSNAIDRIVEMEDEAIPEDPREKLTVRVHRTDGEYWYSHKLEIQSAIFSICGFGETDKEAKKKFMESYRSTRRYLFRQGILINYDIKFE